MSFGYRLLGFGGFPSRGAAPFNQNLIGKSAIMNGSDTYFTRTPSAGNRTRWTLAWWFQLNAISTNMTFFSANDGANEFYIRMDGNSDQSIKIIDDNASMNAQTIAYQRDIGWYHCIISYDSTIQNADFNRIQIYLNGERQRLTYPSAAEPALNGETFWNDNRANEIGRRSRTTDSYTNAYMAQIVFLNGDSIQNGDVKVENFLDTQTFGTNGSQFIPKATADVAALATAAGGNSFCLDFDPADPTASNALGLDVGNSNNFTATNIDENNQSVHTPSKAYPTFNPLAQNSTGVTLSDGNLKVARSSSNFGLVAASIGMSTGKWYCEVTVNDVSNIGLGIVEGQVLGTANRYVGQDSNGFEYSSLGTKVTGGSYSSYGDSFTNSDVIGVIFDADNGKLYFSKNGTIQNSGDTGNGTGFAFENLTNGPYFFAAGAENVSTANAWNFGQSSFAYTPPSGFNSLNSSTLTAPTYQGIDYFDNTLYEGNAYGQRVGDFMPVEDVGTITRSFLADGRTNSGTTDLTIAHTVSTTPTNVQVKTLSFWIKPVDVDQQYIYSGSPTANDSTDSSERIFVTSSYEVVYATRNSGSAVVNAVTEGSLINDVTQWSNVVVALNYASGVSSASDRLKIYINGVLQTLHDDSGTGLATAPAEDMSGQAYINAASTRQLIGTHPGFTSSANRSNVYLAEMYMVDGQALAASAFGQLDTTTNKWVPKAPATIKTTITGTGDGFGSCGFYLDFLDAADLGDDDSGNSTPRDFTESATIDATNQVYDSPSENFATLDIDLGAGNSGGALEKGNLRYRQNSTDGSHVHQYSTLTMESGKYYAEYAMVTQATNRPQMSIGILKDPDVETTGLASSINQQGFGGPINSGSYIGAAVPDGFGWGQYAINNDGVDGATLSSLSLNDNIFGILLDLDNRELKFSINGTVNDNLTITNITKGKYRFASSTERGSGDGEHRILANFGQLIGGFEAVSNFSASSTSYDATTDAYWVDAPPAGYVALREDNLDATASKFTGLAWIKNRDAGDSHVFVDRVRGVGKRLESDSTAAQTTEHDTVQRFYQRGVQIAKDDEVGTSNESYVLWQWLVGDSATTGSTTSPAGSLASTSLVADAGHFSIINYTGNGTSGATIGHGMPGAPEMIWIKELDNANGWIVGSDPVGYTKILRLDTTDAETTDSGAFNNTAPSSTLITLGSNNGTNRDGTSNGNQMICYAFRSVPGVCKIGSYIGNGSSTTPVDGPYVSVGFRPSFVLIKVTDLAGYSWSIFDIARSPNNGTATEFAHPNSDTAAYTSSGSLMGIDFLSDGFKQRSSHVSLNQDGKEYLYMAIADIAGNGTLPPIYSR